MFDPIELNRIWDKTDMAKISELIDNPTKYCADYVYLIDYHLSTNIGEQVRENLLTLKNYIQTKQDEFVSEQLSELIIIM